MAGLQRSAVSFRRQGSSGLIWDDKLLSGELNQKEESQRRNSTGGGGGGELEKAAEVLRDIKTPRTAGSIETSRSNGGGRGYRTGKVEPAVEPPSPKLSVCGFCGAFGRREDKSTAAANRRTKAGGKRKTR